MLAWSRESITDVRKPETAVGDVIVGGELFTDYSDHPRKLVTLKPKTQINRRRTLPASFLLRMPTASSLVKKDFSPKSQDAVALQCDYDALYLVIDRDPSGNRPLQQYLGFTAGRCYGQFEHKADSLIAKIQRSGRNGQRD